ncbi:TetR/AcrR family transcriptional regulator [Bergeriella denitrificans]|uniref:TetR family transcriptional regulator n=1 Tax=Bergeriella denitrificans TaxID=494 RepID=A0A378UER9_BERDE|nr:TetR/AcrR family transcriptional regulator [Bergeriella denitrificans]STZ75690.1 TetR family transcriptional regulator [Bergeriella denitrificans]
MTDTTHQKFIRAGLQRYPELGYHKLSVRALAAEAGVSPGMFHHLFTGKDAFIREMLRHHDRLIWGGLENAALPDNPFAALRGAIYITACSMRDNLAMVNRLLADSADGVAVVNDFIKANMEKRLAFFTQLLEACAETDDSRPAATTQRLAYLGCSVSAAMVVGVRFGQRGLLPGFIGGEVTEILSDEAIMQRIDWSLGTMFPSYEAQLHSSFKNKPIAPLRQEAPK